VQSQLELLTTQIAAFQPEFTIPFASVVYFCNEENAWMNDFMVKPRRVEAMNLPGVHFMYPGDAWTSEERSFRSHEAVERYMADLEKLTVDSTPPGVGEDKIKAAVLQLLAALQEKFGKAVLRRLSRFEVYVHDLKRVAAIDPGGQSCEFRDANAENAVSARYTMCSQVLWYTFAHTWGWGTTAVSGMYLARSTHFQQICTTSAVQSERCVHLVFSGPKSLNCFAGIWDPLLPYRFPQVGPVLCRLTMSCHLPRRHEAGPQE
jgi:UDP-MurNAc hydroxylase